VDNPIGTRRSIKHELSAWPAAAEGETEIKKGVCDREIDWSDRGPLGIVEGKRVRAWLATILCFAVAGPRW
jgi:hypothetical protein